MVCVPVLYLNIKKILLWEGWKTECSHQSICLIYFRTNEQHCCSCQGHHQVWALAIPPKLGHPWQRGAGGGAPLARLFCISNNFNNHEHKREEDTLKWVKKNLLVIYSCTYNFCQSYCVTLYILHDFFLFWCATQILLVVPIWPHL